jgi:hypothetical protein
MAKVKAKALDSFLHGRLDAVPGTTYTMNSGDAEALARAGLVEIVGDADDEEVDDLVGSGRKMQPLTSNKMEKAASNKADKK